MATPCRTLSTPPSSSALSPCSSIVKEVYLCDWWLVKADPSFNSRQLSVGGINSEERIGIRVFHSAPILKRYNNFTLETADGITVTICGTINRSRTLRNGFTQQVCNHFVMGFPYYWEEFANQLFSEESTEGPLPRVFSNLPGVVAPLNSLSTCSSGTLDDLPGALLHDFSLSTLEDSANCEIMKSMFGDILEKYSKRENDYNKSDQEVTRNSIDEDSPIKGVFIFCFAGFTCLYSNVVETIPNPLLDRMEIISTAGYITDEKMHISRGYLEKNTREASVIKPDKRSRS